MQAVVLSTTNRGHVAGVGAMISNLSVKGFFFFFDTLSVKVLKTRERLRKHIYFNIGDHVFSPLNSFSYSVSPAKRSVRFVIVWTSF